MGAKQSRRGRGTWLTVAAVAVVLVFGYFIVQRWQQRAMAARAFASLAAADSVRVQTEILLHLPPFWRGAERPFTEVVTRLSGDVLYTESGTPEMAGTLYAEAKGRGTIFFADGDMRLLEDEVRFRLDNIPIFLHRSGALVNRWTRVPVSLLATRNPDEVRQALDQVFSGLARQGKEVVAGERLVRYAGSMTEDVEGALQSVLREEASGSPASRVLARLLAANNVASLDVWVDPKSEELRRVRVNFVRPLKDGSVFDFATVTLAFSDFGRAVTVDRPETRLVVQPDVFANLFGAGKVEE